MPFGVTAAAMRGAAGGAVGGSIMPSFIAAGSQSSSISGNISPGIPGGVQSSDLMLLQLSVRATDGTVTPPGTWSLLFGPDGAAAEREWVYSRFHSGTESSPSVAWTGTSSGTVAFGRIYAYRNVAPTSFTEGGGVADVQATSVTIPAITTTGPNRLAVAYVALADNIAIDAATGATGGTWIESVAEALTDLGFDGCLQVQHAGMMSAGTISGGSIAFGGPTLRSVVRSFALKPA